MIYQPSSCAIPARIEVHYDKARIIDAVSINCNRRFRVNMHSKMTATRHVVNLIGYGNYDKKGFRNELSRKFELNLNCQSMKYTN